MKRLALLLIPVGLFISACGTNYDNAVDECVEKHSHMFNNEQAVRVECESVRL